MHRVSIGLPVYNGENYLTNALDSLLSQTFKDFELIISDNASTDGTREICKEYAAKDQRVRYHQNKANIGAVANLNQVFELSKGTYFKWAHHDDICAPEYIERCVEVLDQDPSIIVCHPKTIIIDAQGNQICKYDDLLDFRSPSPSQRLRDYLFRPAAMWNAAHGLIRSNELKKTLLHRSFLGSDQVLIGEILLLGKIYQVSERLFYRRSHEKQGWRVNTNEKEYAAWYDPGNKQKIIFPKKWKIFYEYFIAVKQAQISFADRLLCYFYVLKWGGKKIVLRNINDIRKDIVKHIRGGNGV